MGLFYKIQNRLINSIDKQFNKPKFSLLTTIYFNLRLLPFKQAYKLPIYFYGKWCSRNLSGSIVINSGNIHPGMYKFGYNNVGFYTASYSTITLFPDSKIILGEDVRIDQGTSIYLGRGAVLDLNTKCAITDFVKILCFCYIHIGYNTRIGWESQIMDYNFHYTENIKKKTIKNIKNKVYIADRCWFGNRCSVMPGAKLPDDTIVGSNSLVNADYIKAGVEPYSLLAGSPAVLKKIGIRRVWDNSMESKLNQYFTITTESTYSLEGNQ